MEQFHTEFCSNTLKYNRCIHRTCFSCFSDSTSTTDMTDKNWLTVVAQKTFLTCWICLVNVFGEGIVKFKSLVIFRHCIQYLQSINILASKFTSIVMWQATHEAWRFILIRYSTQTVTDELMMHAINYLNRI